MKKLKLRQGVKDVLVVIIFYLIILIGVIVVNARLEQIGCVRTDANTNQVVININE